MTDEERIDAVTNALTDTFYVGQRVMFRDNSGLEPEYVKKKNETVWIVKFTGPDLLALGECAAMARIELDDYGLVHSSHLKPYVDEA
jgi:hypothetical protein